MTKCELCNRKVCGYRITSIGERSRNVPMDDKKYTGSDKYCQIHLYNEEWWPQCGKCTKKATRGAFCDDCNKLDNIESVFSDIQNNDDEGWTKVTR